MGQQERQARGDYYPKRPQADCNDAKVPVRYIPYPKAMKSLADRLDATPEELAAWVWLDQRDGGVAAYLNANESDPPPRFYYVPGNADNFDYLSPLMACWFSEDDIANFEPADRFITGKTLIKRWSKHKGIQPEAFIRAKIAESRLLDAHPIFGGTQGSHPDQSFPPMESGLFVLAHVEAIEMDDFDIAEPFITEQSGPCQPVEAWKIRQHFRVIRGEIENDEWWKEKMADAKRYGLLDCRAGEGKKGRSGGSLWKPAMIAGWLVDRHENGKDGMTSGAARNALSQFPGCEDVAEEMFPPNDPAL